ncbi:Membrane-fusion protein [Nitrospira japonica]|uniref:Membrane-fusion protein n=1 Tax=Nitrospira japonica TaxID=1325564 RepID=A0A1W1I0D2_9BACT|nr:HlyD family efflux transporter periplasmic adaptor subunit [Nitrospira japonica]SLM46456.1 Membrane-fusion protein [Nitrospira japonica]
MAVKLSKKWIVVAIVVAGGGVLGYQHWKSMQSALPPGIVSGNGRIEATLVDASAKEPLRVKKILVKEGDLVKQGDVLVQLDTVTLEAELAKEKASMAGAKHELAAAKSSVAQQQARIRLAQIEERRDRKLLEGDAVSQREYDVSKAALDSATATLSAAQAGVAAAQAQIEVTQASVAKTESRIRDATLVSPTAGRVLYRLVEPGEVLGPGGKALTIVDLSNVYMELFLPAEHAAALKVGAEARITVDYNPTRSAIAYVSFVSPEAQFTPKQVETKSEREKLMFRVKIQVPPDLVEQYIERIKTGIRGVGYVKLSDAAVWPAWLQKDVVNLPKSGSAQPAAPTAPEAAATSK